MLKIVLNLYYILKELNYINIGLEYIIIYKLLNKLYYNNYYNF